MNKKPLPHEAARRVQQLLGSQSLALSTVQALDVVAVVEGHSSWRAWQKGEAADTSEERAQLDEFAAVTQMNEEYFEVWAQVKPAIVNKMGVFHKAMTDFFGAAFAKHGMTAVAPDVDEAGDEFSSALVVNREDGTPVLSAVMALVQSEEDLGYTIRFELEAHHLEDSPRSLKVWTATPQFGSDAWKPAIDADGLAQLVDDFASGEAVYAIQDASIFG